MIDRIVFSLKRMIKGNLYLDKIFRFFFRAIPVVKREELARLTTPAFSDLELKNRFIFVHIPKCGGNSVIKSIYNRKSTGHSAIFQYKKQCPDKFHAYYKFCVVRNPVDRFVSAFNYLKSGGMGNYDEEFAKKYLLKYKTVDDFIGALQEDKNLEKLVLRWTHFIPQSYFVCDEKGDLSVDDVFKLEELGNRFAELCEKLRVEVVELKTVNKSHGRKKISKTAMSWILNTYKEDFDLFGY